MVLFISEEGAPEAPVLTAKARLNWFSNTWPARLLVDVGDNFEGCYSNLGGA